MRLPTRPTPQILAKLFVTWLVVLTCMLGLSGGGCGRSTFNDLLDDGGGLDGATDGGTDGCGSGAGCADVADAPDVSTITAVVIEPASSLIPVGTTHPFVARGFHADGSSVDVTLSATWSSPNTAIASIASPGVVSGVGAGTVVVRATVTTATGPKFGEAIITVTAAALTDLQVSPPSADLPIGGTAKFTATAFFADGSKSDVTTSGKWSTSGSFATVDGSGVVTGVAAGLGAVQIDFDGKSAVAKISVTGKTLTRLEIAPTGPTAAIGEKIVFTATAIYTDGSKADVTTTSTWSSSAIDVASIVASGAGAGTAIALKGGSTAITAAFSGSSAFTTLTVSSSPLTGIAVSPTAATISPGGTARLVATANFADGTSSDITASALWTSSDGTKATVSSGLVTGVAVGTSTITATFGGFSGTAAITVSPAALVGITCAPASLTVPLGATAPLKATGTYAGGTSRDITADVSWSTDDGSIAKVDATGLVTPVVAGTTTARAKLTGLEGDCSIAVVKAAVTSIAVSPSPLSMVQGTKQFVTAKATYSDGTSVDVTTTCTWNAADTKVATVSNAAGSQGQVAAVGVGATTLTCTLGGITGSGSLTVTGPTLDQVSISPIAPTCHVGDTLQFFATAITTAGTSSNVTMAATWSSDAPSILAPVGPPGRFRCTAAGTAHVSATYSGKTGTTPVTVSAATVVVSITVDPAAVTLAVGDSQNFAATAIMSDGTSQNVTGTATWVSTKPAVASITTGGGGPGGGRGRATALTVGTTTIQATYSGVTGSTTLNVSAAKIVSISINPATSTVAAGTTFQYTAQAIYSDGTSRDVTGAATWVSSATTVAQVSDAGGPGGGKGRATALAAGSTTITATFSGISGTASLTVTSATLVSLQVTPFTASVAPGTPVPYRADAIYSDGSSVDVTAGTTWTSSDPSVASVSDAGGSKGRASAIKAGTVKISATYKGTTGTASLNVTTATLTNIQITPFKPTIPVTFGTRLTATAIYSDGSKADITGLATWTSSNAAVAAVSDAGGTKGRVSTSSGGTATITASFGGISGTDDVVVSAATLSSIAITPNPADVAVSGNAPLIATGTFSDGSTLDITLNCTWISSDASVADVSNAGDTTGFVYGFKVGSIKVTAQRGTISGTGVVNVK